MSNTLTLRPTADSTVEMTPFPADPATHYDKVDEAVLDTGDYVYHWWQGGPGELPYEATEKELYTMQNHTAEDGTIDSVALFWYPTVIVADDTILNCIVKMAGTEYPQAASLSGGYYTYSWATNPNTSAAWTWTNIDDLIAGFSCHGHAHTIDEDTYQVSFGASQFYVVVTWTSIATARVFGVIIG